jgi:hypothetical protein
MRRSEMKGTFTTISKEPHHVWCNEVADVIQKWTSTSITTHLVQKFIINLHPSGRTKAFKLLRSLDLLHTKPQIDILFECSAYMNFPQPRLTSLLRIMWQEHRAEAGFDDEMIGCIRELSLYE